MAHLALPSCDLSLCSVCLLCSCLRWPQHWKRERLELVRGNFNFKSCSLIHFRKRKKKACHFPPPCQVDVMGGPGQPQCIVYLMGSWSSQAQRGKMGKKRGSGERDVSRNNGMSYRCCWDKNDIFLQIQHPCTHARGGISGHLLLSTEQVSVESQRTKPWQLHTYGTSSDPFNISSSLWFDVGETIHKTP